MKFEIEKTGSPLFDVFVQFGALCWVLTFILIAIGLFIGSMDEEEEEQQRQKEKVSIVDDLTPEEQRKLRSRGAARNNALLREWKRRELGE